MHGLYAYNLTQFGTILEKREIAEENGIMIVIAAERPFPPSWPHSNMGVLLGVIVLVFIVFTG